MYHFVPLLISVFKDRSDFNINNMESDKEVISRLKFIGKVQKGEKINVKYMFVQPEGISTRISRTWVNQCGRQNTLNFLRNTITRTFEIISSYSSSNNESKRHICTHVINDLKLSKKGIVNLKNTYLDDLKIGCDLDTLLEEIDAFLSGLKTDSVDDKSVDDKSVDDKSVDDKSDKSENDKSKKVISE